MSQHNAASPIIFLAKQHTDAALHTLQDLDYGSSATPTPTSGSSFAGLPQATLNELSFSPCADGRLSRDISSRDSLTPHIFRTRKVRENEYSEFELKLHSMTGSAFDAFASLHHSLKDSPSNLRFTRAFYQRIEDYLDQEGLYIEIPSNDHIDDQAKDAVRRLIIARTVSENPEGCSGFDSANSDRNLPSYSLRNNILCSTLAQRRSSLSHTSSLEIEAVHQSTMIKKSAFHTYREVVGINEEKETPSASKDSFGVFSDIQSALSRKKSARLSSCLLFSPKNQLQSPSPSLMPVELGKKFSFVSPQKENQEFLFLRTPYSPLTALAKKPRLFEEKVVLAKTTVDITSFGEFRSKESTPMRSPIVN